MIKTFLSAVALTTAMATSTFAATVNFTATASTGVPAGYGTDIGAATWFGTSDPAIVNGTVSGGYRSPYNELATPGTTGYSNYFTVGSPAPNSQPSPATLVLNSAKNTFSMLWGSIDTYNAVQFCLGSTCAKVTGSQVGVPPLSAGGSLNAIVNFTADFYFDRISFFSNEGRIGDQAAFEFAVAPVPVPLPAGGLLLLGALGGIAALRRRRSV